MLNTNISEIMSQDKFCTFSGTDTVSSFLKSDTKTSCYLVDSNNNLLGIVNERKYLQFLSPMLPILERETSNVFMEKLSDVPLTAVAEKNFKTLKMSSTFSDVLRNLIETNLNALPVVDDQGKLMGEVTYDSVLCGLESIDKSIDTKSNKILRAV